MFSVHQLQTYRKNRQLKTIIIYRHIKRQHQSHRITVGPQTTNHIHLRYKYQ